MADHLRLPREHCLGEMSPEEKAAWVARFGALSIGAGANDSLAIAHSLAGKMNPLLFAVLMPASSLASLAIVFTGLAGTIRGKHSARSVERRTRKVAESDDTHASPPQEP